MDAAVKRGDIGERTANFVCEILAGCVKVNRPKLRMGGQRPGEAGGRDQSEGGAPAVEVRGADGDEYFRRWQESEKARIAVSNELQVALQERESLRARLKEIAALNLKHHLEYTQEHATMEALRSELSACQRRASKALGRTEEEVQG